MSIEAFLDAIWPYLRLFGIFNLSALILAVILIPVMLFIIVPRQIRKFDERMKDRRDEMEARWNNKWR